MKNKKNIIISIMLMVIGLGLIIFGLIDFGYISVGKLKGSITDETASFKANIGCEKTTIEVGETTTCKVTVDVGSNTILGLNGKISTDFSKISITNVESIPNGWKNMGDDEYTDSSSIIGGAIIGPSDEYAQTGVVNVFSFNITGTEEGSTDLELVPYAQQLQVADSSTTHDVTATPTTITVSNGGVTPDPTPQPDPTPDIVDTSLKSLSLSAGTLTPTFNKDIMNYTASVANNVDKITVNAVPTDSTATVTGNGEKNLNVGENTIEVVVKKDGGTDKTYTIVVTRNDNEQDVAQTDLKNITITNGTLIPSFDKNVTEYVIEINPNTAEIGISAEPEFESSKVTGAKTINVKDSAEQRITIEVTDSKGNVKKYFIQTRAKTIDTECVLTSEFYGIDNLDLLITKVDLEDSDETITSRIKASCGTIKVSDNKLILTYINGKTKTYVIERSWSPKTGNDRVNYIAIMGGIILLIGVALFIFNKKQDK